MVILSVACFDYRRVTPPNAMPLSRRVFAGGSSGLLGSTTHRHFTCATSPLVPSFGFMERMHEVTSSIKHTAAEYVGLRDLTRSTHDSVPLSRLSINQKESAFRFRVVPILLLAVPNTQLHEESELAP